jgi:carbonic anhydrase
MAFTARLTLAWVVLAITATAVAQRTPDEALRALQEGNQRFIADRSVPQPLGEGVRRTLARGQSPFAIVLCCADSRVPPEHVFNTGLGELFVVRVAGHTCDAETLASIEYAVEHLNTPLCVVLGHENCGAVAAAIAQSQTSNAASSAQESRALQQLLEQIEPAVRRARTRELGGKQLSDACEEENVHYTVQECLRRSDLLRRYASVGRFRMLPARYHLDSGEVEWLPVRPMPAAPLAETAPVEGTIPTGVPPHVALRMLQAGHRRFLGDRQSTGDISAKRREELTHGQQPLAIVLACADSRTPPEHVFDAGLGELFVVRIAGNALNDDALASVEYAAAHTGASLLVVMGHTRCGAVQAALDHPEDTEMSANMRALLSRIEPSVAQARASGTRGDLPYLAVRANVLRTVTEARSRSALLRRLEGEGRFALLPAVYDIATGDLSWLRDSSAAQTPAAAPAGETQTGGGNGSTAARGATTHGSAADDHGHGGSAGPKVVPMPTPTWPDPGEEPVPVQPMDAHGAPDAHGGETQGHDEHRETPSHDAHADARGHGEHAAHEPPAPKSPATWLDLRFYVGLAGVVSLSLAALLVLRRRG